MMVQSVLEGTHNNRPQKEMEEKEILTKNEKKTSLFCFNDDYNNDIPINGKSLHVLGLRFNFSIAICHRRQCCVVLPFEMLNF